MAVHQASEGVRTDEAGVLRVQLLEWGGTTRQGLRVGLAHRPKGWARPAGRGSLPYPWVRLLCPDMVPRATRALVLGFQDTRGLPTSFPSCPS